MNSLQQAYASIANGGTTSGDFYVKSADGWLWCGLYIPAAFTGTSITFLASSDGVTYNTVKDGAGNAVSLTVAAGDYVKLDPQTFAGVRHLQVVSGSSEGAKRNLIAVLRS